MAELEAALSLRLPPDAAPAAVVLRAHGPGYLQLAFGDQRQSIALGDLRGAAAARVIALVIADRVRAETAPPSAVPVPAEPQPEAKPPAAPPKLWLGASARAGKGLAALEPFSPGLATSVQYTPRRWLLEGDVELFWTPNERRNGVDSAARGARVRAQAGLPFGPIQALLGAAATRFSVSGGTGFSGWLGSLGAALRFDVPLRAAFDLTLSAGVDYSLRRFELQAYQVSVIATPRVELWLAAGVRLGFLP
ncbi:MAG TPA: hypothetical protein VFX59_02185 [Polyangiales bacterium]|nr:hypothetical protein [Polyangiales bacterium]